MSFFGFDTSKPRNPNQVDEILEQNYKEIELEEDNDELNDETFNTDIHPKQDFDFTPTYSEPRSIGIAQGTRITTLEEEQVQSRPSQSRAPTLEEVEQQMFRQHISRPPQMSLEQVEQQLRYHTQMRPYPQRPLQPQQPTRPLQVPSPLVINGVRYAPVQISSTEKMAVFDIFQKLKPLFIHIEPLVQTLYQVRGDTEMARIQTLQQLKAIVQAQMELLARGIFILHPQGAQEIHSTLVGIFQYAESVLLPRGNQSVQGQSHVQPRHPQPSTHVQPGQQGHQGHSNHVQQQQQQQVHQRGPSHQEHQRVPSQPVQRVPSPERVSSPEVESEESGHEQEEQVQEDVKEVEDTEPVLDINDFPALGAQIATTKERHASQPTVQRERQGSNQKREPGDKKKKWVKLESTQTGIVVGEDPNIPREEKYKGLMRKYEKELIAKIQISQLVTDEPMVDDFYFQMYKKEEKGEKEEKKGKKSKKWLQSSEQFVGKSSGTVISNQMQQQMKRLVESRRTSKPREPSVALEKTLGTIGKKTAKNPKQAIALPTATRAAPLSTTSHIANLKMTEKIYSAIIKLESLERKKTANMEPEELEQHEIDITEARNELWRQLVPADEVELATPHPLVCAMNIPKGLRAAQRALLHLGIQPALGFFSLLFKRFECLEVANVVLGQEREKVELFMNSLFPTLTTILNEATLPVLNALMQVILERHNLLWIAKSRVGLVIMTMILSRAELLKQGTQSPTTGSPSEEDLGMWGEVYDFIFVSFQNQFPSLFAYNVEPSDEVYIWQFLSAMAVGASGIDHQRILVTELRENIISTAKTNHPKAMENVNLFLTALGLNIDAAQLAAMSS